MKRWVLPFVLLTHAHFSCAGLIRGNRDYFAIHGLPEGAALRVNGAPAEPGTCLVFERHEDSTIDILQDGRVLGTIRLRREVYGPALLESIYAGGVVGAWLDHKGGGLYELKEDRSDSGKQEISSVRLESECGPSWNRYRVSILGGVTVKHKDPGRRTPETQFNQGWLTLGGRGFQPLELFTEVYYLRYADTRDRRQEEDTAFSLPFPGLSAPAGLNLYLVSLSRLDVFLGAGLALFSGGAGNGLGPSTAHLGFRVRFKDNWELTSQLKYLTLLRSFGDDELDSTHLAERWILQYGVGRSWR
ncbi:MAG: hypothetical protein HYT87_08200 [Nitrospirae bacterium]|nr:hypothetical protein [Nitrospirota bacterium]